MRTTEQKADILWRKRNATSGGGGGSGVDLSTATGVLAISKGGTGATSAPAALISLGAYPATNPSGFTSNLGTVTSVAASVPTFLSISGSPITVSGTLAITYSGTALPVANGGTGQTSYTDGQLLIGNSTGNTLDKTTLTAGTGIVITNGSGSITISSSASALALNVVTGTTQTAVVYNHYVLTNAAATTVTLPATPTIGDIIWITVGNGLTTNIIASNGNNIQSIAEDCTLNTAYASVQLRYINSTIGWTFV